MNTEDAPDLETDVLLILFSSRLISFFRNGFRNEVERRIHRRNAVDKARALSLGTFMVSIVAISSTYKTSSVLERPIQSSVIGFFFIGLSLLLLQILLGGLLETFPPSQSGLQLRGKDEPLDSDLASSTSPIDSNPPDPRSQRFKFYIAIVAICARGYLPLLVTAYEYKVWRQARNYDVQARSPGSSSGPQRTTAPSPILFLGPVAIIAFANVLSAQMMASPSSTYICPIALGQRKWMLPLQILALFLDASILIHIKAILSRKRSGRQSKPGRATMTVSLTLIVSAISILITGVIASIIQSDYRRSVTNIDKAYVRDLAWMTMIFAVAILSSIRIITSFSASTFTILVSFVYTSTLGLLIPWKNQFPFPAEFQQWVAFSIFLLFLGSLSYVYLGAASESMSCFCTQRTFTRVSFFVYTFLISLVALRLYNDFPRSNELIKHPIDMLMSNAIEQHEAWVEQAGASKTLSQAVVEYRRRYKRHPPPGFGRWYEYATKRDSLIIDDFDSIYEDLLPFWAVDPSYIRARTHEIISDQWNEVGEVKIRSGKAEIGPKVFDTHRWMIDGAVAMLNNFVEWLPDMDLALNINDESRVAVPFSQLEKYQETTRQKADLDVVKDGSWSNNRGHRWDLASESSTSSYSPFTDHSFTNTFHNYGSISCPPNSPARQIHNWDPRTLCHSCFAPHSIGPFIHNWTLSASPCHQPDLANLHGYYLSPAAFKTAHDLIPVFSQSKAHGYADILYPSPWNYQDKIKYEPSEPSPDPSFVNKKNTLFWRGATSEGVSTLGTWKGMTRQRLVHLANNLTASITVLLPNPSKVSTYAYQTHAASSLSSSPLVNNLTLDIAIVDHIVRCRDADCPEQEAEFGFSPPVDFQSHWRNRYLMDVDGAGFSGRFLPFLQSHSLPFKAALFREWYDSRIFAWRHFVPIDLRLHGLWSTLAYFAGGGEGGKGRLKEGESIAEAGREWVDKVLRKEDMEIYFFRLLLEWGRLTDDRRDELGFEA